jgi:hypothetical protein
VYFENSIDVCIYIVVAMNLTFLNDAAAALLLLVVLSSSAALLPAALSCTSQARQNG